MLDLFTFDDLKVLMQEPQGVCVSLYMPTHPAALERHPEDQLRLQTLLKTAGQAVAEANPDLRVPDVQKLLEPATTLIQHDGLFWRETGDGLAIFLSQNNATIYRLPLKFDELLVVTGRFHIKPLLPLMAGNGRFYILALSQHHVRLLQGTRDNVTEVSLEGVPTSLEEALQWDERARELQLHTVPSGGGAIYHSHDTGSRERQKTDLLRYFQQVAAGIQKRLAREDAPLILAGVEYLLAIYREANKYPHLLEAEISGNPEMLSHAALHEQAWASVEPIFQREQQDAADLYRQVAHTAQASDYLRAIIPAAYAGRVATLFTAVGRQQWGTFDSATGHLQMLETPAPNAEDLLNLAAVYTLSNSGTVYAVPPEEMPAESDLAAIFRY